jgi:CYTH domain-containing protein
MPTFYEHYRDLKTPTASLEGFIDGSVHQEIEFCIYAEIKDLEELKKKAIAVERHEQWQMPLDQDKVDGKMRLRLIDDTRPTMATKIKRANMIGCEEVESDITMDAFKHLKQMAFNGYVKQRYTVPSNIAGLQWEVDVFYTKGGSQHPWVKIDLEVKSLNDPIPAFPIATVKQIYDDEEMTHGERTIVRNLWDNEWQRLDANEAIRKEQQARAI